MSKNAICRFLLVFITLAMGAANAAFVSVDDAADNNSRFNAFNVNPYINANFNKTNASNQLDYEDTNYQVATTRATNAISGSRDWYSFTIDKANVNAFFDIDFSRGNLRTWLAIYDANGTRIEFNGVGEMLDAGSNSDVPGSGHPWDSFIAMIIAKPGKYFVSVGQNPNNAGLLAGQNYTLHIGLSTQPVAALNTPVHVTPIPAGIWLFGSAILSLFTGLWRKNNKIECKYQRN